jgi:hypothetical protein
VFTAAAWIVLPVDGVDAGGVAGGVDVVVFDVDVVVFDVDVVVDALDVAVVGADVGVVGAEVAVVDGDVGVDVGLVGGVGDVAVVVLVDVGDVDVPCEDDPFEGLSDVIVLSLAPVRLKVAVG